jgi:hypothetical protein
MQLCEDFNNCYPLLTGLKYPSRGPVPANKGCCVGFEASRSLEMLRVGDMVLGDRRYENAAALSCEPQIFDE